jgi:uncharacterized protein involved in exopolysaccharide biosynthesis/Mrp family chromosome partitioning ATPase
MSDKKQDAASGGLSLQDIYFILFRQKWIILFFSAAGISAAVAVCLLKPPQYQSEAELSVRYVVEGKSLAPGDETRPLEERTDSIINTEVQILTGWDLAEQVAEIVTPERILAKLGGGSDTNRAAYIIVKNLAVDTTPGSSLIHITFQHPDPDVVVPVLNTVIDTYMIRHFQMHQGVGFSSDLFTNEMTRLRVELDQTEKDLREAQDKSHVISSVEDAKRSYSEQVTKLRENIFTARADLEERQALLQELEKNSLSRPQTTNAEPVAEIPPDQFDAYKQTCIRLDTLEKKDVDYLVQGFTDENVLVKEVRAQIADLEKQKIDLEEKYPKLMSSSFLTTPSAPGQPSGSSVDLAALRAQVTALKSKTNSLEAQLSQVWLDVTNFEKVDATISELQRKKEEEQANLNYFNNSMEKTRIDNALGDGKASNISFIQHPTPPAKGWPKKFEKKVTMMAVGGIAFGLALAFLIELVLDRSVRRPSEIESRLKFPLFITLPKIGRNVMSQRFQVAGENRRQLGNGESGEKKSADGTGLVPWDRKHPLRPFYEELRDRLMVYFEVKNLNHKPKLVAITSCGSGAGVSSTAAGLAASLSETGDGNVLLVSMNGSKGAAQQFYKGQTGLDLDAALETDKQKGALVEGNFYMATESTGEDKITSHLPKRLKALMPKLKASDYDYIIFDMPPVSQISPTPKLAQFMDMVFMVVESEKTDRDVVKRATDLLAESKTNVGIILNKNQNYVPRKLLQEL